MQWLNASSVSIADARQTFSCSHRDAHANLSGDAQSEPDVQMASQLSSLIGGPGDKGSGSSAEQHGVRSCKLPNCAFKAYQSPTAL